MKVKLVRATDLYVCSDAIRECHDTKNKSDKTHCPSCGPTDLLIDIDNYAECQECGLAFMISAGDKDKALIDRVGNKMKHASTLEHLTYTFQISGISRAVLQELARHRMASLTVKSTRYTLSELAKEADVYSNHSCGGFDSDYDEAIVDKYLVMTSNEEVNMASIGALVRLQELKKAGIKNDVLKYCLPESYKTSLTWTINARSLQNFINLRTHSSALWEIQNLANAVFESLPEEHKYLFENFNHITDIENAES